MPNFAASADTAAPRFASGGGGGGVFPKMPDLVGSLVALKPVEIEKVQGYTPPGTPVDPTNLKDRLAADTTVLDGDFRGEYPGMWWGQSGIVKRAGTLLRKNAADPDIILGRLRRIPKKEFKKYWPTPADLEAAFALGAQPIPITAYFWVIEDGETREADVALATAVLTGQVELESQGDGPDPFE